MSQRQDKKKQFEDTPKKRPAALLVAVLAIVAAGAAFAAWTQLGGSGLRYEAVSASEGRVSIPLGKVSDGKAHFFSYASGGGSIDFFVLKSQDGAIRVAFDACDVCYREKMGYRQEGEFMVCINCNQKFRSDRINEIKGGCNPAPLNRTFSGGKIVIAENDLAAGLRYFRGAESL